MGNPTNEEVEKWIREYPNLNIGLVLGQKSGIIGIDVDGQEGLRRLKEISKGDIPRTLAYATPGGGRRYLYRVPEGVMANKWSETLEGDHSELALLGNGQQTIMPPAIHPNGGIYRWFNGGGSGMIPQHIKNKRKDGSYRINHYYICNKYHNQGKCNCRPNSIRADEAEEAVLKWLEKFISQPFILKDILKNIKERNIETEKGNGNSLIVLEAKLMELDKKQQELIRLYEDDKVIMDQFLQQLHQYKLEKEQILTQLNNQQLKKSGNDISKETVSIKALVDSLKKSWFEISYQKKKEVIRTIINKVNVDENRKVKSLELRIQSPKNTEIEEIRLIVDCNNNHCYEIDGGVGNGSS